MVVRHRRPRLAHPVIPFTTEEEALDLQDLEWELDQRGTGKISQQDGKCFLTLPRTSDGLPGKNAADPIDNRMGKWLYASLKIRLRLGQPAEEARNAEDDNGDDGDDAGGNMGGVFKMWGFGDFTAIKQADTGGLLT